MAPSAISSNHWKMARPTTPVERKEAGTAAFGPTQTHLDKRYLRLSNETAGHYRVGISPTDFFDTFMPWNKKTSAKYKNAHPPISSIRKLKQMAGKTEKDMYGIYRRALNTWAEKLNECDGKQTHIIKTWLSLHRMPDPYTGAAQAAVNMGHYGASEVHRDAMKTTDFSLMQTQVEFKAIADSDSFVDPEANGASSLNANTKSGVNADSGSEGPSERSTGPRKRYPCEKASSEAAAVKGQIAAYAAITLYLAYRTHLFTVAIFGKYCRFIRWDRRGAVVTRRIDYTNEPELLFQFYHRFAQLTRHERGFDPTVTRIDPASEEAKRAKDQFDKYSPAMLYCQAGADKPAELPFPANPSLLKMTVVLDGVKRSFIMPSPSFHFGCLSPFSRSIRRCLIYDPTAAGNEKQEVLFMKDYWREDSDLASPEATVYKLLKEKGVTEYVAEMEIGGDIDGLRTRWQEPTFGDFSHFTDPSMMAPKPLQAHRIFLKTIAADLTGFKNAHCLVKYVTDGMQAAYDALVKAQVLHRDISAGNIMIRRDSNQEGESTQVPKSEHKCEGRGILIDWDHCIILSDPLPPRRKARTGTWQFMSINILQNTSKPHSFLDDQESAYWVLLYVALRYLKNNLSPDELLNDLQYLFNQRSRHPHEPDTGGRYKLDHLGNPNRFNRLRFDIPGLVEMFNELADTLSVVYSEPPSIEDRELHKTVYQRKPNFHEMARAVEVNNYDLAQEKVDTPEWFIETLRDHASRIPVPSNDNSSDYHYNPIPRNQEGGGSQSGSHFESQLSSLRLDGMSGRPIPGLPRAHLKRTIDFASKGSASGKRGRTS